MPIATPQQYNYAPAYLDTQQEQCAHCGAPITWSGNSPWGWRGQWRHDYPGPWYGQMICDPQQARAAQQGRQAHV